MISCPVCNAKIDPKDATRPLPFCSQRCRHVDLSRWLGEQYGLPWELDPDAEEWQEEEQEGGPPRAGENHASGRPAG
jgi:endogenous inhibitor of DNA gyrase (YacG/DUF329 family)